MAKSPNQKLKLLYLMNFMLKKTDEEHTVTLAQMIEHLASLDISAERKSLYDDLEALRRFGIEILTVHEGNRVGYYVSQREFQLPELKLLVDAVQSSKFITYKKSLELIKKLEGLASEHEGRRLNRQLYVKHRIKTMNESIYYNVDEIQEAIDCDRAVSFKYFDYSRDKKRIYRHNGKRYNISPYALTWDDENYYMIGFDGSEGIVKHFRVDKMSGIDMLPQAREGHEVFDGVDFSEYTDAHFDMFSGREEAVRMKFEDPLAGAVIDRFGTDVIMTPHSPGYFTVTASVAVSPRFFGWVCGFGRRVEIIGPERVVLEMKNFVSQISELYK